MCGIIVWVCYGRLIVCPLCVLVCIRYFLTFDILIVFYVLFVLKCFLTFNFDCSHCLFVLNVL